MGIPASPGARWFGTGSAALLGCALSLPFSAPASASQGWLAPVDLSERGRDASNAVAAADDSGDMVVAWERQSTTDPTAHVVQVSTRRAGEPFSAPFDLSFRSTEPKVAMTPGGETVVAWRHFQAPFTTVQVSSRPPKGSFSPPATVYTAPEKAFPQQLRLALDAGGDVALAWSQVDPESGLDLLVCEEDPETEEKKDCPNPRFVMASVRPAGGAFSPAARISPPRGTAPAEETEAEKEAREKHESQRTAAIGDVAIDAGGDAIGVWTYFDGSDRVAQAALRPAAGGFGTPEPLTEPGESANDLDLAMDVTGDATAIWNRLEGSTWTVRRAERAAGGEFGSPQDLSEAETPINSPEIAMSAGGATVVVWRRVEKNRSTIEASSRPAGGSFSAPAGVSSGIDNAVSPDVAMNTAGDTVVVWSGESGGGQSAKAAVRPRGGAFGIPTEIAEVKPAFFLPHPALDASGNAIVVWLRNDGVSEIVQAAGYDAQPPELRGVSIPASAEVGEVVPFSAKGFDEWPTAQPSFDFGDGNGAVGESVAHAYGAPGTYRVSASVVDSVGNPASAAGSISVIASNRFSLGRLRRNRRKGTAILAVRVPGPGVLSLSGPGVARTVRRALEPGEVELRVKAAGRAARRLARHRRARLRLRVNYAPDGGPPAVQELAVTLRKSGAGGGRQPSRH